MTFSTELLVRELAAVSQFDGVESADFAPAQLHDVIVALGKVRRSLDALVIDVAGEFGSRCAPELGVAGLSRREGFSTPQEMLAKLLGSSTYDAKRLMDVGKALAVRVEEYVPDGDTLESGVAPGGGGSAHLDGLTGDPDFSFGMGDPGSGGEAPPDHAGVGEAPPTGDCSELDAGDQGAGYRDGSSSRGDENARRFVLVEKHPYLTTTVAAGAIGSEAAALVAKTLNAIEPVLRSNALVKLRKATDGETNSDGHAGEHTPAGSEPDGAGDQVLEFDATALGGSLDSESNQQAEAQRLAHAELREYERRLVDKAQELSIRELRRACDRERAWLSPKDVAAREQRQREERTLFFTEDADGMTVLTAKLDAASAAPLKAWVEAQVRWAFQQRRQTPKADGNDIVDEGLDEGEDVVAGEGRGLGRLSAAERCRARAAALSDERTAGQIRIDALVSLAQHGLDCDKPTSGVKTTVVLRMDVKDLEDDLALGECDQVRGPISVGTLRTMAADAQVVPMVMGGDSLPLDVGKHDRFFTRAQRLALAERDGGCSWCHAPPSFCQAHHIDWWAKHDGRTDLSNGVLLCTSCHHRIHRDGWGIDIREGQVWFQPAPVDGRRQPERIGGKAHLALAA
ncbi:HNH endonuclease [Demequina aurantiaca]|uniref:HNH endonuclease n=1 Tax=Demequina aurantiaca TaxID=676200 RepID=UPI000781600B|nr:HNH endonuclease signature motif containing protein [Demequina aurantiaca]